MIMFTRNTSRKYQQYFQQSCSKTPDNKTPDHMNPSDADQDTKTKQTEPSEVRRNINQATEATGKHSISCGL